MRHLTTVALLISLVLNVVFFVMLLDRSASLEDARRQNEFLKSERQEYLLSIRNYLLNKRIDEIGSDIKKFLGITDIENVNNTSIEINGMSIIIEDQRIVSVDWVFN